MKDWFDNGILGSMGQRMDYGKVGLVALQVDFGVGQFLAMNPGSPLGVSKKGRISGRRTTSETGDPYRKTAPALSLGGFLPVNTRVLFGVFLRPADED